jgi:toxin ParE1/3/4
MSHHVSPKAEDDLDDIWLFVARDSGSIDRATSLIDFISERFFLLADFPLLGRSREADIDGDTRSFPVGEYVIVYMVKGDDVVILRVVDGRRDLEQLFR